MKFAFIAARDVAFPVSAMCRVLGVTRSGFYAWVKPCLSGCHPRKNSPNQGIIPHPLYEERMQRM